MSEKVQEVTSTTTTDMTLGDEASSAELTLSPMECDSDTLLANNILDTVSQTNAFFKSQQRGDPELSSSQKKQIAGELLRRDCGQFLARYGKFLDATQLQYFEEQHAGQYEVEFYLKELRKDFNVKVSKKKVRNRRYEVLRKLVNEGDYFSDSEIKKRSPLLYEQLVGRYLSEEERKQVEEMDPKFSFSELLLEHLDRDQTRMLYERQQDMEDGQDEEFDEDEEDSEEDEETEHTTNLADDEKQLLREELMTTMYRKFLDGRDRDFDYSTVDNNADYDNLAIRQQDEEDDYFDTVDLSEDQMSTEGRDLQPSPLVKSQLEDERCD